MNGKFRKRLRVALTISVLMQQTVWAPLCRSNRVMAGENGVVVGGSASIIQNGNTLNITTQTDRTIINWDTFNIQQGHTTNFYQPGANSAVLNRVITSNNPSAIYGNLNSNGNVYLVNPSGIVVGPSGMINTNGFTASVLDISNNDFMRGNLHFRGDSRASVINQGTIRTGNGGSTLIGGEVINEGLIESEGNINLLTGGSIKLKAGGVYTQADQATLNNGISETAGLIRNDGTLRATGALEVGGEVYLVSPGGNVIQNAVVAASRKDASGKTHGGKVVVDAGQGTAKVTGRIDVQGETGGSVTVTGKTVRLEGADINASGQQGGGRVNIGGGFQGKDASIANSESTVVDADTSITAQALASGDGGTVILWSDGETSFQGNIYTQGSPIGQGGFVEVSGKQQLSFEGWVNTGGGDLLLDPYNYNIDATAAGNIVANLANNNITIQTSINDSSSGSSGNSAEAGDIAVNSAIVWSSDNSLTFLAHGDIHFNANVQNSGAGDVNAVAGWDGTTAFDATTFQAADVSSTTLFGNNSGSIFLGSSTQTSGVAVGSAHGNTNVFGHDLTLRGSDSNFAYAQLGFYHVTGGAAEATITTGDINIGLTGSLSATAGTEGGGNNATSSYVQIGHGGNRRMSMDQAQWRYTGNITVNAVEDITFQAGVNGLHGVYAQLGHGGVQAMGTHSGNHTVTAGGNIRFQGGNGMHTLFAYALLGNGGHGANNLLGDNQGDMTVVAGGSVEFLGGTGNYGYAQLGNGGYGVDGGQTGNHSVTAGTDVTFQAGNGYSAYAQLGNGGFFRRGNHSGNHTIVSAQNILFLAGGDESAYAQFGNGGNSADGSHSGNMTIGEVQNITFTGGTFEGTYAQLGNGGHSAAGNYSGNHTITSAVDIVFTGGSANQAYAQFGNGGFNAIGNLSGDMTITRANDITFQGGTANNAFANFGNSAFDDTVDLTLTGDHQILEANDITFQGGSGSRAYAQFGNRYQGTRGNISGDHTIGIANDVLFEGGAGDFAYVQFGNGGDYSRSINTGNLTIENVRDLGFIAGPANQAYAQFGNGGYDSDGTNSGDLSILSARDITFQALGNGFASYAQMGNGGSSAELTQSGNLLIAEARNLTLQAGETNRNYAQIGHGSLSPNAGTKTGSISLNVTGETSLVDGDVGQWVIGHRNSPSSTSNINFVTGTLDYDATNITPATQTTLNADFLNRMAANLAGGDVTIASTNTNTGATGGMLVLGGDTFNRSNTLNLISVGDIRFQGNVQNSGSGDLNIIAGWDGTSGLDLVNSPFVAFDNTSFLAAEVDNTTLFGNNSGSIFLGSSTQTSGVAVGSAHGNTNVFGHDLTLQGSDSAIAYAQLGYHHVTGGTAETEITTGDINVGLTGSLTALAGTQGNGTTSSYVQIGHGGNRLESGSQTAWNYTGDMTVEVVENLTFTAGSGQNTYAQFGHGGRQSVGNHSGELTLDIMGDLSFTSGSNSYAYSRLGHGGHGATGSHSGNLTIVQARDITFSAGTNTATYTQLGHGGGLANGNHAGDIEILSARDILFQGGSSTNGYAQLGNGGGSADGIISGNHTIQSANDVTFSAGTGSRAYALLGNGGVNPEGTFSGNHSLLSVNNITFTGGGLQSFAQFGNGGVGSDGNASGTLMVDGFNNLTFTAGSGQYSYAQFGHGGYYTEGNHSGHHTIQNGQNVTFQGGDLNAHAQFGNGGRSSQGNHSGNLTLSSVGEVNFTGGTGSNSYAQMGNGGHLSLGDHSGNHLIENAVEVSFNGGSSSYAYAHFGNGGLFAEGNHSGNLAINNSGDLFFLAGEDSYVQLGHGGMGANGNHSGDLTLEMVGNVTFTGGTLGQFSQGSYSYAQLGHGGVDVDGDLSGDINLTNAGNITFTGTTVGSYAQLGHGGFQFEGNITGNLNHYFVNDVNFSAGDGQYAYAQLGHGGAESEGTFSGAVTLLSNSLTLNGNSGEFAYAQIGHGGVNAEGIFTGNILTFTSENLVLNGYDSETQYAMIGSGNQGTADMTGGSVSGDVTLSVGQSATLSHAVVGHRMGPESTYSSGNTWVVIGVMNLVPENNTDTLTTDANTQFTSASLTDGGELRFYLPNRDSVNFADGTLLNGTDVATFPAVNILPNEQGYYPVGQGPYVVNPVFGNFAFYFEGGVPLVLDYPAPLGQLAYDQFDRYEDYFRTIRALLQSESMGEINLMDSPQIQIDLKDAEETSEPQQTTLLPEAFRAGF